MTAINIIAQLKPTEDPQRVTQAIMNIFGDISLYHDTERNLITGKITELHQLKELRGKIAQDRIRTTINNTLSRWASENYLSFGLNRQAAYVGHISLNLTNEDPMGPIQVQVKGDVQRVIEYLSG
jgi:predicted RNA binding protein with dsRBD fold (UPF0201 family)